MVTAAERYDDAMAQRTDQVDLFAVLAAAYPIQRVLYPGSYLDVSPSFVFPSVTYVDTDRRAKRFFADAASVRALVLARQRYDGDPEIVFHHADYTSELDEAAA